MLPRRRQERPMLDLAVEREMRELHAQLYSMEKTQRRDTNRVDVSEAESENGLEMKEKLQLRMLQKNIYSELLQE